MIRSKMNRRQFLRTLSLLGVGFVAACTSKNQSATTTPVSGAQTLVAPVTGGQNGAGKATTQAQAGSMSFDQFMAFSRLMTGSDTLDPNIGQTYFQALQAGATSGSALSAAYAAASSGSNTLPKDVEALTKSGFFEKKSNNDLAVQVTDMWYSGVYSLNGEDQVATYIDALAWQVLEFTKPPTVCRSFGFWAKEPQVQISPDVQYTPMPAPGNP